MNRLLLLPLLLIACNSYGQKDTSIKRLHTTKVRVQVMAILEGASNRGIVKVLQSPDENFPAKKGEEFLAGFVFGTKPNEGYELEGVTPGDVLLAEVHSEYSPVVQQHQYSIFRYSVVSAAAENEQSPPGDSLRE